jgi:hypothetical protein
MKIRSKGVFLAVNGSITIMALTGGQLQRARGMANHTTCMAAVFARMDVGGGGALGRRATLSVRTMVIYDAQTR